MRPQPYRDRRHAGQVLADHLRHLACRESLLVLGLPRGGVPVAYEVAQMINAPLDVFVVRKLGLPGHEEFAIGALASGGTRVLNRTGLSFDEALVEDITRRESAELARRERLYRGDQPPLQLAGRSVVLVDDGLATGATMRAAAQAVRKKDPASLCIAAPVGAPQACRMLEAIADEVVCPAQPEDFTAVSLWYASFPQTGDEEVQALLEDARHPAGD